MSGWIVRWRQANHHPNAAPYETTVYASVEAAMEWAALVQRQGATEVTLVESPTSPPSPGEMK